MSGVHSVAAAYCCQQVFPLHLPTCLLMQIRVMTARVVLLGLIQGQILA